MNALAKQPFADFTAEQKRYKITLRVTLARTPANAGLRFRVDLSGSDRRPAKWQASILLIEGKASGLTVHQELRRLHFDENWSVQLVNPKGDKVVRALAAQPTFAQGLVYAPVRDWSQMVIDEMELFPKGRYDDLTDSTTMAVSFLRSSGLLHRPRRLRALYPC
jgi:predicted phage terminase large subunit-like protein